MSTLDPVVSLAVAFTFCVSHKLVSFVLTVRPFGSYRSTTLFTLASDPFKANLDYIPLRVLTHIRLKFYKM